jgi:hypothetical protein
MLAIRLEYIGVTPRATEREYTMRLREVTGERRDFKLVIASEVFRSQRARYQDGPDICFQKMQRELQACEGTGTLPNDRLLVTDAEIDAYRESHKPMVVPRKPKATPPTPVRANPRSW